jgi:hypothetical protein
MRTTISLSALVIAAGLAAPALAQTATEGGKQPAKPGVQSGQQQSDSKDMTTPGTGMKPGSAEAPQGGKQPAQQGVQSGQKPDAATGQGTGTSGAAGTGTSAQPGVAPEHQRSATEDMTRAVPTMKPGDQPAATGAAQGQGPGGWTADQKLRATDKEGAVEKPGPGASPGTPPSR